MKALGLTFLLAFALGAQFVPVLEGLEARDALQGEAHHHDGGGCHDPCADGSACGDGCPCMCCPGHGPSAVVPVPDLADIRSSDGEPALPYRSSLVPALLSKGIFHPPR